MRDTESITETQQHIFFLLSTDSQQVKDLRESYKTATEYLQNCKLISRVSLVELMYYYMYRGNLILSTELIM